MLGLLLLSSAGGCATAAPCPAHAHSHEPSDQVALSGGTKTTERARVVPHSQLKSFENNGNQLVGIATPSMGVKSSEVWRTSVAPGSATPPHTHASEEIFIFLRGQGRATVGSETIEFEAPATVIAPAGVMHRFENTGTEPTDAIVVVGAGSKITNQEGQVMNLPWRK